MITVMGATGNTGRAAAERLLATGAKVRAIGRSTERLQPLVERGAEAAVGDVTDAGFLTSAFQGAEALYVMFPPDYAAPDVRARYDYMGSAIETALHRSGVRRAVMLSSLGGELSGGTGPIAGLHAQEERFKGMGLDLMILRPGYFYENLHGSLRAIKEHGVNGGAIAPDVPVVMTATADIGAAAAEELAKGEFRGAVVRELLGPRDYTMTEATRILGERIGRPDLPYVQLPDEEFVAALVRAGLSDGVARSFLEMSHAIGTGLVRSHQGRTPRTTMPTPFEAVADRLAAAYRVM